MEPCCPWRNKLRSEPSRKLACQIAPLLANSAVRMDACTVIIGILTAIYQHHQLDGHDCFRVRTTKELVA
ncbi:unnamed protein product [Nippostrongylus brasiliensis]|uniref:Uncharacterized protein n=1 Tax=Nippostrongylus brasiliensis TaxID=27835 RepID=A0A0N4YS65_NIPBR|nr:unnamed protein product [Nippostrongylus brasiliensis]